MATPNYAYEKRQRELAKKRKKEEKAQRKTHETGSGDGLQDNPVERGPAGPTDATGNPGATA